MSRAALAEAPAVASDRTRSSPLALGARTLLVVACLLVGIRAVALLSAVPTDTSPRVSAYFTDGERYHRIATHEGSAYRDFDVEYPPVTYAFIEVVAQDDVRDTLRTLGLVAFALDLLTLGALMYGFGRRAGLAYLVLSTPLFLMPFVYFRVDFLVVALATWGVALIKRHVDVAGGALLAVAVFAKLWPLALVPLVFVDRRTRAIASVVVCGMAGALAWLAMGGTDGYRQVLSFRGARGFQIESVVGGALRLVTGETPRSESGALRIGDAPFAVTVLLGAGMVAGIAWVWWQVHRSGTNDGATVYGLAPLTAVAVFLACSPLLSPQFVIWLVPFAALAWVFGERVAAALVGLVVVVTMLLTQVYGQLNDDLLVGHAVLAVRNALLLAVVVTGVVRLRHTTRSVVTA